MSSDQSAPPPARSVAERGTSGRKKRRTEDRTLNLVLASTEGPTDGTFDAPDNADRGVIELQGFEVRTIAPPGAQALVPVQLPRAEPREAVFILDLGREEALLVAGAEIRCLPRGEGGADLLSRAAAGAAVWRRERARVQRRLELPDLLIAFAEHLNRAESSLEVCEALSEYAARIVGGYTALVFMGERNADTLHALQTCHLSVDVGRLFVPLLSRFSRPGLITAAEARPDTGGPFVGLTPLFADLQAVMIAHVPLGDQGVLCLVERREERMFDAEDWDLLRTLSGQATAALERVRLFAEVRDLSLTDPLTGLANRRRMKVVLEHSMAAARRGESLAVVMIDLDRFKAINDEQGHVIGDRILMSVAELLRQEARGSDLVVRYGGDEFLVVLPGGNAAGAYALLQRVRERLGERVGISAGVAEYEPRIRSAEELIEAADRDLYAAKRRRNPSPPPWRSIGMMPSAEG